MALAANTGDIVQRKQLEDLKIHASEWSWVGTDFDLIIDNNDSVEDLYRRVEVLI
jgi:hypothetical protein